jgi:homoserine acetyltransferase
VVYTGHDPFFAVEAPGGDVECALRSIKVPFLYMPSESDLYFPVGDARYEAPSFTT